MQLKKCQNIGPDVFFKYMFENIYDLVTKAIECQVRKPDFKRKVPIRSFL